MFMNTFYEIRHALGQMKNLFSDNPGKLFLKNLNLQICHCAILQWLSPSRFSCTYNVFFLNADKLYQFSRIIQHYKSFCIFALITFSFVKLFSIFYWSFNYASIAYGKVNNLRQQPLILIYSFEEMSHCFQKSCA